MDPSTPNPLDFFEPGLEFSPACVFNYSDSTNHESLLWDDLWFSQGELHPQRQLTQQIQQQDQQMQQRDQQMMLQDARMSHMEEEMIQLRILVTNQAIEKNQATEERKDFKRKELLLQKATGECFERKHPEERPRIQLLLHDNTYITAAEFDERFVSPFPLQTEKKLFTSILQTMDRHYGLLFLSSSLPTSPPKSVPQLCHLYFVSYLITNGGRTCSHPYPKTTSWADVRFEEVRQKIEQTKLNLGDPRRMKLRSILREKHIHSLGSDCFSQHSCVPLTGQDRWNKFYPDYINVGNLKYWCLHFGVDWTVECDWS